MVQVDTLYPVSEIRVFQKIGFIYTRMLFLSAISISSAVKSYKR